MTNLERREVRGLRIKVCLPDRLPGRQKGGLARSGGRGSFVLDLRLKGSVFLFQMYLRGERQKG